VASYKTAFGSHLKTEDLQGRAVPVSIECVTIETLKGNDGEPDQRKPVARFVGKEKTLVLNLTRCGQLEAIFGTDDMDYWAGPVMLVPGQTKFGGKTVGCIDIKPRTGPAAAPPPPPAVPASVTDDDIPF
jgi:hypothetical protein